MDVRLAVEAYARNPDLGLFFTRLGARVEIERYALPSACSHLATADIAVLDPKDLGSRENLRELRQASPQIVVIISTHDVAERDRLPLLEAGADDLLDKDRGEEVLIRATRLLEARKAMQLRTAGEQACPVEEIQGLFLYGATSQVASDHARITLAPSEFTILRALIGTLGHPVTRDTLMDMLYGTARRPDDRILNVHISNLRRKMARARIPVSVEARRGEGYYAIKQDGRPGVI